VGEEDREHAVAPHGLTVELGDRTRLDLRDRVEIPHEHARISLAHERALDDRRLLEEDIEPLPLLDQQSCLLASLEAWAPRRGDVEPAPSAKRSSLIAASVSKRFASTPSTPQGS
jgi:hypothetical protein